MTQESPPVQAAAETARHLVKEGQTHLTASRYGAASASLKNRSAIAGYHEGLLGDISGLIDLTEAAAKRAAGIVNSGVDKWYAR